MGKANKSNNSHSTNRPTYSYSKQSPSCTKSEVDKTMKHSKTSGTILSENLMKKEVIWQAIILFSVIFSIYFKTLHPSLPGGDSGEIIVAAFDMGVAHPPGYPLFTLLAKLFMTVVPLGSVAWRVNLLSAVSGALSSSFIFLAVYRMTSNPGAGVLSAGMFAFSRLTWTWSVSAEVFALNNLLISALIFTAVTFDLDTHKTYTKVCLAGAFLCGLCLTNQHTSVLFIAVIVPWVFYCLWVNKQLTLHLVLQSSVCCLAGLLPYIYLPVSSLVNAARWTWGDQSSLRGFLTHFLRQEYGTLDLLKDHEGQGFVYGLMAYIHHAWTDLTPVICVLFIVSMATTIKRWYDGRCVSFLLVCYLMLIGYLAFFCWRANLDINNPLFFRVVERFWIQSDLLVCFLAAVAFDDVTRFFCQIVNCSPIGSSLFVAVLAVACQVNLWWATCNQADNYVVHDFATQTLASFPRGSIVLTKGDLPSNSLRYFHLCENVRPDITVFDQEVLTYDWSLPMTRKFYPHLVFPGDRWQPRSGVTKDGRKTFTFRDLIDANYNNHPIFACIGVQNHELSWQSAYTLQPFGVCWRLVSLQETLHIERLTSDTDGMGRDWKHELSDKDDGSWEHVATAEMWRGRQATALYFLELALQHPAKSREAKGLLQKSFQLYSNEMRKHASVPAYWHRNLGIVCEHLSRLSPPTQQRQLLTLTVKHFTQAVTLDPSDPDVHKLNDSVRNLQSYLDATQGDTT